MFLGEDPWTPLFHIPQAIISSWPPPKDLPWRYHWEHGGITQLNGGMKQWLANVCQSSSSAMDAQLVICAQAYVYSVVATYHLPHDPHSLLGRCHSIYQSPSHRRSFRRTCPASRLEWHHRQRSHLCCHGAHPRTLGLEKMSRRRKCQVTEVSKHDDTTGLAEVSKSSQDLHVSCRLELWNIKILS